MDSPIVVGAAHVAAGQATVKGVGDGRVNLSVLHLLSAASFTRRIHELEQTHSGQPYGPFWEDIFANACAVVFSSVAALESYVNELFIDHEKVFPSVKAELMVKLWETYELKPTLEKIELALLLRECPAFDRGAPPYQDVAVITRLRNALVHFKPEWFSEQEEHAKLSAQLTYKAAPSPFFPQSEPLFPRGWASYATAVWIVRSVYGFVAELEDRARLNKRMIKFKDRVNAL